MIAADSSYVPKFVKRTNTIWLAKRTLRYLGFGLPSVLMIFDTCSCGYLAKGHGNCTVTARSPRFLRVVRLYTRSQWVTPSKVLAVSMELFHTIPSLLIDPIFGELNTVSILNLPRSPPAPGHLLFVSPAMLRDRDDGTVGSGDARTRKL